MKDEVTEHEPGFWPAKTSHWPNGRSAAKYFAVILSCLAIVCLSQKIGLSSKADILLDDNDDNQFETEQNTWDANWDLDELRHRLVSTQRQLTTQDQEFQEKLEKLEADVNVLMGLYRKRPPGPVGKAGPVGPPGPPGKNGADGKNGAAGQDGKAGPAGLEGPPGVTGEAGSNGLSGSQGLAGPQGVTGRQGDAGAPGQPGPQGEAGLAGRVGPEGAYGEMGPPGPVARINVIHHLSWQQSSSRHSSILAKISHGLDEMHGENDLEKRLDALSRKMQAFKRLLEDSRQGRSNTQI